jgi:hypothetical protein
MDNMRPKMKINIEEVNKSDQIAELLKSPTWKHRKEELNFTPFKTNYDHRDVKKKRKKNTNVPLPLKSKSTMNVCNTS